MDNGNGSDHTPSVRDFSQGAERAISGEIAEELRKIVAELRGYGRATFPPAVSFCELADRVSAIAARLVRHEEHRGMSWGDIRLANDRREHGNWEQFKGHAPWEHCGCDLSQRIRKATAARCSACKGDGVVRDDPFTPTDLVPCEECAEMRS